MFIFYFAILSMVTPPVALASYAAAGLAKSDIWETGWRAFKLSFAGFLVPFAFVFNNALVMQGPLTQTIWTTFTATLGVYSLATAIIGYSLGKLANVEKLLFFAAAVLLIDPGVMTDITGLGLLSGVYVWRRYRFRRAAAQA
jgi:TRAP-type uncharacterized transport system fused permease subunit